MGWLNRTLHIERGIVHQVVDDVKTLESQRLMHVDDEMLEVLKTWKQITQFSSLEEWLFASPAQIGRLPYSYAGVACDPKGSGEGSYSTNQLAHVPVMAGFGWYAGRCSATADAPHGHQNHDEHLR